LFRKNLLTSSSCQDAAICSKDSRGTKDKTDSNASSDDEPSCRASYLSCQTERVNPITGAKEADLAEPDTMTPEEKEREAVRLLHLFNRMEKNGIIQVASSFPEDASE